MFGRQKNIASPRKDDKPRDSKIQIPAAFGAANNKAAKKDEPSKKVEKPAFEKQKIVEKQPVKE